MLTHTADDAHQDHRLVCELTWNTFRDHLILEYEIPKWDGDLGRPNVYVPLDEAVVARKVELLLSEFPSQADKHWFDEETFRGLMRLRGPRVRLAVALRRGVRRQEALGGLVTGDELAAPGGPLPVSPPAGRCPACGSGELEAVLELTAPKHTSMLVPTRAEALAFPRGTIRLEVCRGCGFLTNAAFDAPGHDYGASDEETQFHSSRFRVFAHELVERLAADYPLAGGEVLEVGPGRGDFLALLCDVAGCDGHGVGPSWRFDLPDGPGFDRVRMTRAFLGPEHLDPPYALVVCRHTLEHVHDVGCFLRLLGDGLRSGTPLFFEVPDTMRILRERAFWDVFYEHCSYFTAGSLARAFRRARMAPETLELVFEGQYLHLAARVGGDVSRVLAVEEEAEEVVEAARAFAGAVEAERDRWSTELAAARRRGETTVIWGAGSKGVGFLATLGLDEEIACAVDVNPAKHGMHMPGSGHEIVAPEALVARPPDRVLVMNPVYADEIRAQLRSLGLEPAVEAV